MASKSHFPILANPTTSPQSEKKKKFLSDAALWVIANEFFYIFQRSLFSPRMSPSVAFHPFFMGLILNAGIKEASKS